MLFCDSVMNEIKRLYCDLPYHNFSHAERVERDATEIAARLGYDQNLVTLSVGAYSHDMVYVAGSPYNEYHSANTAATLVGEIPDIDIGLMKEIILDTTHKSVPDSITGMILCDADLMGLSDKPLLYACSAFKVKKEYEQEGFTDLDWLVGRTKFLEGMIGRKSVYWLGVNHRYERQAFDNMMNEYQVLTDLVYV